MENNSMKQVQREINGAMLQERRRRKRRKIIRMLLAWLLALFIILVVIGLVVVLVVAAGGRNLRNKTQSAKPNLQMEEELQEPSDTAEGETGQTSEPAVVWQEGWVRHNGKIYEYNDDIMTFLVLGIDKQGTVKESTSLTGGGQSDAIFLVIINPDDKDINILGINRDTITTIQKYGMGPEGSSVPALAQIAVQHGFGDGKELSCELTLEAVSALLYDLPIHGYLSVNMGAIAKLNDAVGGVEVSVLEDMTKKNKKWTEGAQITLKGKDAVQYVQWRDTSVFESARGRLARQKQYLTAFAAKFKDATKKDITLPVKLYQEFSKYIVTDVTVDEIAYLAGQLLDYSFDGDAIHTLEGTTVQGEIYEEFYPDKQALKEQMLELFYQEVEQ